MKNKFEYELEDDFRTAILQSTSFQSEGISNQFECDFIRKHLLGSKVLRNDENSLNEISLTEKYLTEKSLNENIMNKTSFKQKCLNDSILMEKQEIKHLPHNSLLDNQLEIKDIPHKLLLDNKFEIKHLPHNSPSLDNQLEIKDIPHKSLLDNIPKWTLETVNNISFNFDNSQFSDICNEIKPISCYNSKQEIVQKNKKIIKPFERRELQPISVNQIKKVEKRKDTLNIKKVNLVKDGINKTEIEDQHKSNNCENKKVIYPCKRELKENNWILCNRKKRKIPKNIFFMSKNYKRTWNFKNGETNHNFLTRNKNESRFMNEIDENSNLFGFENSIQEICELTRNNSNIENKEIIGITTELKSQKIKLTENEQIIEGYSIFTNKNHSMEIDNYENSIKFEDEFDFKDFSINLTENEQKNEEVNKLPISGLQNEIHKNIEFITDLELNEKINSNNPTRNSESKKYSNSIFNPISDSKINTISELKINPVSELKMNPISDSILNPILDSKLNTASNSKLNTISNSIFNPISDSILNQIGFADSEHFKNSKNKPLIGMKEENSSKSSENQKQNSKKKKEFVKTVLILKQRTKNVRSSEFNSFKKILTKELKFQNQRKEISNLNNEDLNKKDFKFENQKKEISNLKGSSDITNTLQNDYISGENVQSCELEGNLKDNLNLSEESQKDELIKKLKNRIKKLTKKSHSEVACDSLSFESMELDSNSDPNVITSLSHQKNVLKNKTFNKNCTIQNYRVENNTNLPTENTSVPHSAVQLKPKGLNHDSNISQLDIHSEFIDNQKSRFNFDVPFQNKTNCIKREPIINEDKDFKITDSLELNRNCNNQIAEAGISKNIENDSSDFDIIEFKSNSSINEKNDTEIIPKFKVGEIKKCEKFEGINYLIQEDIINTSELNNNQRGTKQFNSEVSNTKNKIDFKESLKKSLNDRIKSTQKDHSKMFDVTETFNKFDEKEQLNKFKDIKPSNISDDAKKIKKLDNYENNLNKNLHPFKKLENEERENMQKSNTLYGNNEDIINSENFNAEIAINLKNDHLNFKSLPKQDIKAHSKPRKLSICLHDVNQIKNLPRQDIKGHSKPRKLSICLHDVNQIKNNELIQEINFIPQNENKSIYHQNTSNLDINELKNDQLLSNNASSEDLTLFALQKIFKLENFRHNQKEIIEASLRQEDIFVLMPTGGGKSITFQLPAILNSGITIVVSPLLSLIQDQVAGLLKRNIPALAISSQLSQSERALVLEALASTDNICKIFYVTPELVANSSAFQRIIQTANIARIVIDEAHCVSQWGHDFRPDYTRLGSILTTTFGQRKVPIIALTATASPRVREDILHCLHIPHARVFTNSFNRKNLSYFVRKKTKKDLDTEIVAFINTHYPDSCGIIYCLSQKDCESTSERLNSRFGLRTRFYHAGLAKSERLAVQRDWHSGSVRIIIATIAFGMGIDKHDVRFVIHYSLPKSLEGYYQETGRAGRDGHPATCILFYAFGDKKILEFMIDKSTQSANKHQMKADLRAVISYCENTTVCRRTLVLHHLGEEFTGNCNKTCDNCLLTTKFKKIDVTEHARNIFKLIMAANKVTPTQAAMAYKGMKSKKSAELALKPGYGLGVSLSLEQINEMIKEMLIHGSLTEKTVRNKMGFAHSYLGITRKHIAKIEINDSIHIEEDENISHCFIENENDIIRDNDSERRKILISSPDLIESGHKKKKVYVRTTKNNE